MLPARFSSPATGGRCLASVESIFANQSEFGVTTHGDGQAGMDRMGIAVDGGQRADNGGNADGSGGGGP